MPSGTVTAEVVARELAAKLIDFLETGNAPDGLFTADAFCDFTMPEWRLQAQGARDIVAMRKNGHPAPGRVPRSRFDATATGFPARIGRPPGGGVKDAPTAVSDSIL